MRLVLHPKVFSDISKILGYYERTATTELADDFYQELPHLMRDAAGRPESFPIYKSALRRVNLRRFPYHFLFRLAGDAVRILVVRHHRRHPAFGLSRR